MATDKADILKYLADARIAKSLPVVGFVALLALAKNGILPPPFMPSLFAAQVRSIAVDPALPPATTRELWDRVTLVIHGIVEVQGPPQATQRVVSRRHSVRVVEVLKADTVPPPLVSVIQLGGNAVVQGQEISTDYQGPLLEAKDEVILFLIRAGSEADYAMPYGAAALFIVDRNARSVGIPIGVRHLFSDRRALPLAEFLGTLRKLKRDL